MRKNLYIVSFLFICFLSFVPSVNAEIIYDITSLSINDTTLTLDGWGLIHYKHNGRYYHAGFTTPYSNTYTFKLRKNGVVVDTKNFKHDIYTSPDNSISATCLLRYDNNHNGTNDDCIEYFKNRNLSARDATIQIGSHWFYDMIDFSVSFDVSKLENATYTISMDITTGYDQPAVTETINPLYIVPSNIHNNSTKYKVLPSSGDPATVTMLATPARLRDYANMNGGKDTRLDTESCSFIRDNEYTVVAKEKLTNGGAYGGAGKVINKYKLSGEYTGCSRNVTNYSTHGGAYSFWVQASGNTKIEIKPGDTGTGIIDPPHENLCTYIGKSWAYQNPGKCCAEFPETCCGGFRYVTETEKEGQSFLEILGKELPKTTDFIINGYLENKWSNSQEILDFCCKTDEDNLIKFGSYSTELPTFAYYGLTSSYCDEENVCTGEGDYYYLNGSASTCCNQGKNGNLSGEAHKVYNDSKDKCERRDYEEESTCNRNNNNCSNNTYFNENKACCCGLYGDDPAFEEKCDGAPTIWDPSDQSCNNAPSTSTIIASGEKTTDSVKTSEKVSFIDYRLLSDLQREENILKSGTGLEYEIGVAHTIKNEYVGTDGSYVNPLDYSSYSKSEAKSRAESYYNNYIKPNIDSFPTNDEFKTVMTNTPFKFQSLGKSENYILEGEPTSGSITNSTGNLYFLYKHTFTCWPEGRRDTCERVEIDSINVNFGSTKTYTYNMILNKQYIAKLDGNISNNVTTSQRHEYLDGENKFYTEIKTTTGVYDFNVTINNSGVTGNLSTTTDGFSCQYGVVNKTNNYDCTLNGCPDETDEGGRGFYFRQISLNDPFPNRYPGLNWRDYFDDTNNTYKYITHSGTNDSFGSTNDEKGSKIYQTEPMFKVTLDSNLINEIKRYNRDNDYDYGWTNMTNTNFDELDSRSSFIDEFRDFITVRDNRDDKVGDF